MRSALFPWKMQNSHPSASQSDRKGMFSEDNQQYASAEQMLTVMASKAGHPNIFHLRHSDMNPNNRRAGAAAAAVAAAAIDHSGGGGMEHLFPYDVHSSGQQTPGQLLPFNLFQMDQSNVKSTTRQQQQQKWIGDNLHKAQPPYSNGRSSLLTAKDKKVGFSAPTSSPQLGKLSLRNPKKAPRGCPAGHWWCKLCGKFLMFDLFNPKTKAMQYKYLCAACETKTKQDQAEKFKRGRDGNVNPKHPRRVGAQNKTVKDEERPKMINGLEPHDKAKGNSNPPKKRRRRGRQWGSVEKVVNSFDPNVDWRLVVLGIRNQNVQYATNFKAGKDFASQDLLLRFRHWAMLLQDYGGNDPRVASSGPPAMCAGADDGGQMTVARRMDPDAVARCAKVNLLLQRIQSLGAQQRLVSQELDDCLCTLMHLQRTNGLWSSPAPHAATDASVPVFNTRPAV